MSSSSGSHRRRARAVTAALAFATLLGACDPVSGTHPAGAPTVAATDLAAGSGRLPSPTATPAPAPSSASVGLLQAGRRGTDVAAAVAAAWSALGMPAGAVTEGVDWPGPGAVVVTFLLPASGTQPPRRLAAGVVLADGRAHATGDQWVLPVTPWDRRALSTEPLDDGALHDQATTAVAAAGLTGWRVVGLRIATDAWPIVADLRRDSASMAVWLRRAPTGLVVAGLPTDPPTHPQEQP